MAKTTIRTPSTACQYCKKPFYTKPYRIKAGIAKYCSIKCRVVGNFVSPEDRFWPKVLKADGSDCWLWLGSIDPESGYGKFHVKEGESDRTAHSFAYELTYGALPPGFICCHTCDNPPCVRPDHLFPSSVLGNAADMARKDRQASILTREQVNEIRSRYLPYVVTRQMLADEFGVTKSAIEKIVYGESWRHG